MTTIKELLKQLNDLSVNVLKDKRDELADEIKDIDKLLFLKGDRKRMPRKAKAEPTDGNS